MGFCRNPSIPLLKTRVRPTSSSESAELCAALQLLQAKLHKEEGARSGAAGGTASGGREKRGARRLSKKKKASLPVQPVALGLKSPGQLPPFAPGPGMIQMLVVEDDPFQADSIMLLCEQCGYKAQVCSNGKEALEVVRRILFDQCLQEPWWASEPRAYLSREQARVVVASLLAEVPTATADAIASRRGPVRDSALPMHPMLPHVPIQRGPVQVRS